MSESSNPESATASLTAVNAWAASGISAERVTLEKPTPLTATLHRFSHMGPLLRRRARQVELRQGDLGGQFLEHDLDAPPDLGFGILRFQKIAGEQCAGRIVELDDDAGVGHSRGEALVASVIHDRIGVDFSQTAYRLEFQVCRDALGAGRIGRVLEMPAALAALQFQNAAL